MEEYIIGIATNTLNPYEVEELLISPLELCPTKEKVGKIRIFLSVIYFNIPDLVKTIMSLQSGLETI